MKRTKLDTLGRAMLVLSGDIVSDDGVASAAILEAGQRLLQLHADLAVILPTLPMAARALWLPDRAAYMEAVARLAAEVLA